MGSPDEFQNQGRAAVRAPEPMEATKLAANLLNESCLDEAVGNENLIEEVKNEQVLQASFHSAAADNSMLDGSLNQCQKFFDVSRGGGVDATADPDQIDDALLELEAMLLATPGGEKSKLNYTGLDVTADLSVLKACDVTAELAAIEKKVSEKPVVSPSPNTPE